MELRIGGELERDCGAAREYVGWFYTVEDPEPNRSGFGFVHLGESCGGPMPEDPTHTLSGAFPGTHKAVFNPGYIVCATVHVEWGPDPGDGACTLDAAVLWRHWKPDNLAYVPENTPLWAAWSGAPAVPSDHPLAPLAPGVAKAGDKCACVENAAECCVEGNENEAILEAGRYVLTSHEAWEPDEAEEHATMTGQSQFVVDQFPFCSEYTLLNHRSRVQPNCGPARDRFDWLVKRLGNIGDFSCDPP